MQRGFATLLVLLTVFILGGSIIGLIFLQTSLKTPTVSPVPDQQTAILPTVKPVEASELGNVQKYQDNDLKFEFEYSAQQYSVKGDTEDAYNKRGGGDFRKNFSGYVGYAPGEFVKAVDVVSNTDQSFENAPFAIWVFSNPDNLNAGDWFDRYWYYPFNWGLFERAKKAVISPSNEATVGGELVNYGQITYQAGSPKYYYISKDGKMFLVRVLDGQVGSQILSSLGWGN